VKQAITAAAFVLLAACQTTPYGQDPYGAPEPYPYPAPAPYPTEPYPPQDPYAGQPIRPQPPECPISASRNWAAWINAMPGPGSRPMLVVSGNVVTPAGGYQVAFDRYLQVRRGVPPQAFVTLQVASPGMPGATQASVTHEVRWEWPLSQPVGSVIVRCGDKTLAEITNIQTAF
jgi:hypothetical protein